MWRILTKDTVFLHKKLLKITICPKKKNELKQFAQEKERRETTKKAQLNTNIYQYKGTNAHTVHVH